MKNAIKYRLCALFMAWVLTAGMSAETVRAAELSSVVQLTSTYTYEEMINDITELCAKYPGIVSCASAGTSVMGRNIPYLILGNPAAPHSIMIQSSIHGREYIVSQTTMATAEYYAMQFSAGNLPDVFASTCFYIIPMANPDGVAIAQSIAPDWKANANGVDLNRNFPTAWEFTKGAASPGAANFKGFFPASEPETLAVMGLAGARNYSCYISYHQQGNIVYYDDDLTSPVVSALSTALASTVGSINRYALVNTSGTNASGTTTYGGFGDYVLITLQKPGITVECGSAYGARGQGQCSSIYLKNADTWAAAARLFAQ
ncbi:MAG TPA: hypothetical protein DCL38_10260 [Lachnospiraceae bacterium]|nr:hypothetical protein [Lachnospiraceae bacterium]